MILEIIDGILDYTFDTAVLLVSGCVSMVALSGVCSMVTFVIVKQLKRISTKKLSEAGNKIDESNDKREVNDLQAKAELNGADRGRWFIKTSEERLVTLKILRQESITVASSSGSSSEKDAEIREFLEHLIGTLISENLDDVPLTPLSNDVQYENIFTEYHAKLSKTLSTLSSSLHSKATCQSPNNETPKPSDLYIELKKIIGQVCEKAPLLPSLPEYDNESGPLSIESRLEGQSYEDILSTAVLNKIILKSQNGKQSYHLADDDIDLNITNDFEYRFNNHSLSSSPLERLSLRVEEHIEEITTRYQSSDDENDDSIVECLQSFNLNAGHRVHFPELGKDVVDGYDSYDEDSVMEVVSNVDSWEDNWLFQKKKKHKIKTVAQVSVPMLVPNPSEKYRALIGDVDVDETSDLSECSDSILEDLTDCNTEKSDSNMKTNYIYKYDFKNNLDTGSLKGKHYDDSENYAADHDQDSSGVTSISRDISDVYSFSSLSPCQSEEESLPWTGIREAKNQSIFHGQEDSGEGSLETQPENEYLNDGELEPDFHEDKIKNLNHEAPSITSNNHEKSNGICELPAKNDNSSLNDDLAQPPKPGTIAEREHQKWERAAPLPNNPYSKENIEKRNLDNLYARCHSSMSDQNETASDECEIQESIRPDIKKYERDYYVNTIATDKNKETKKENGINSKHTSSCENVAQNGFTNVSNHDDKPKKPNLVRVLSWSDRKQPEVEIRKRLPSVKELAKQFSVQPTFQEVKKPLSTKNQMVHSLTARSMSKEFREGLKKSAGKTYNRNVHSTNDDELDKSEDLPQNGHLQNKLDTTISFWENI
ncbi:uncharacterized protein LOC135842102 isoform X2 [Planococcus citri]|uniref:uncharacterized protein LOC135842102 isoform X2 n=1 Tax=Planococcus citri TaxID=170843 RepID=UPI0031F751AE